MQKTMPDCNVAPSAESRVVQRIRRDIIEGKFKPGRQLPTREALKRHYQVSITALQNAVDRLVSEGFLEVGARKLGTRVGATPPHLHHYKMVFPGDANLRTGVWQVLHDCAEAMDADPGTDARLSFFYGLDGHRNLVAYKDVVEDAINHRVAGLIFASSADELMGTPLLEHPGIPRAALAGPGDLPGIPKIYPDLRQFFDRALAFLRDRGCKSVAVVGSDMHLPTEVEPAFMTAGVRYNPLWMQCIAPRKIPAVNLTRLLLNHPDDRPDAIIVAGERILDGVIQGLRNEPVRIVALSNFPVARTRPGIAYLGFDAPLILQHLMNCIDVQRRGETPTEMTLAPAVFFDELQHPGQCGRPSP